MNGRIILTAIIAAILIAIVAWAIDIDVSGDTELPQVEASVDMQGGELPEMEMDTADISIEEERSTVSVPSDIEVETTEEQISYPTVNVDAPESDSYAEDQNYQNRERGNTSYYQDRNQNTRMQ